MPAPFSPEPLPRRQLLTTAMGGAAFAVLAAPVLTAAQEGTPPPGGFEIAPGVTAEELAPGPAGSDQPALYRLTFAPGVTFSADATPEISLGYLESGELTFTVDAPVTVTRAGATDAPGESVAANTEFTVQAGDYFVFPPQSSGEVRNDGQDPASLMIASIIPAGGGATPSATPAS
jgi:quercetin dioxygenase-like cupin family protein